MKTNFYFSSRPLLLLLLLSAASAAYSQTSDSNTDSHTITVTIPEVALLDIETNSTKDFTAAFTHSGEAGDPITAENNSTLWLNYSSILKSGGAESRNISVAMTGGPLEGITIKVTAGAAVSGGQGTLGTPAGQITLTSIPTPVITGVGSAYTVTGPEKGHQLTYVFEIADYADLISGSTSNAVSVTYTLADN